MKPSTRIGVDLIFSGFSQHPAELTELTGLTPSETWLTGDTIGRSIRKHSSNGWQVSSPKDVNDIEAGVDVVLGQLEDRWEAVRKLSKECRVELSVVVYGNREVPAIHFRDDQIRRLAELSAKIDVDVYCLASE